MEVKSEVFIREGRVEGRLNTQQLRKVLSDLLDGELRRDILLAWGGDGPKLDRWLTATPPDPRLRLLTLGLTSSGRPRHPSRAKGPLQFRALS